MNASDFARGSAAHAGAHDLDQIAATSCCSIGMVSESQIEIIRITVYDASMRKRFVMRSNDFLRTP
jgi:hypothetical protein